MIDHRTLTVPHLVIDSEMAEFANVAASMWTDLYGNDRNGINRVMAAMEPEHVICFSSTLCGEMTACVSVIHDGTPNAQEVVRTPLLSRIQAIGVALRVAEAYQQST